MSLVFVSLFHRAYISLVFGDMKSIFQILSCASFSPRPSPGIMAKKGERKQTRIWNYLEYDCVTGD